MAAKKETGKKTTKRTDAIAPKRMPKANLAAAPSDEVTLSGTSPVGKRAAAKTTKPAPARKDTDVLELPTATKRTARRSRPPSAETGAAPGAKSGSKPKSVPSPVATIADTVNETSVIQKLLLRPVLPALGRENRARLQMQTPTRLFFYWSLRTDPWRMLRRAFGDQGNYALVLKLTDLLTDIDEMHRVEANGSWWFDVEPNGRYRAEIGFFAPSRPYIRIVHSNVIETPRRSPSSRPATEAKWRVSSNKFAEVLDLSGFRRDAFDVALAGDDAEVADRATHRAFRQIVNDRRVSLVGIASDDVRHALASLAAGVELDELRSRVSRRLFSILQANRESISPRAAATAIRESFGVESEELVEEQFGPVVHGTSLVNFPRSLKRGRLTPASERYLPISSDQNHRS